MMANFEIALNELLKNEGVYSDDPDDTGGETVLGISRNKFPNLMLWTLVDASKTKTDFPECLAEDIQINKLVSIFYKTEFWDAIRGDEIVKQQKAFALFDFAVNSGTAQAIKIAQRALGIVDDGLIGVNTIRAINLSDSEFFLANFAIKKVEFYVELVKKRPANLKYLVGWISRALKKY